MPEAFDNGVIKDIFSNQQQRRHAINSGQAIYVSTLAALCGVISFFADKLLILDHGFFYWLFLAGTGVLFVATVIAAIFLGFALWDYDSADLPDPVALSEWADELRAYHIAEGSADPEKDAETTFRQQLRTDYIMAAQINFEQNEKRAWYLFWMRRVLFLSVGIFALTTFFYYVARPIPTDVQKVRFVCH